MTETLYFRESGAGAPLIILHGIFGSGENWFTVAKKFSEHYHVFLVDQRNHGRSPHSEAFSYDLLVNDLLQFSIENGMDKFFLIGHSMGGKVAMRFAQLYPEKLEAMVVVDIAPRYYAPHHEAVIAGLKSVDLEHFSSRNEADEAMAHHISEQDVRQFLLKNLYRKEDGKFAWRINLPILEKAASEIGEDKGPENASPVPALFVRGNLSRYIRKEDEAEILRRFPNAHIEGVEGAGHWVQAEKPEEFTRVVLNFLKAHHHQTNA